METTNTQAALLSNYEVLHLLNTLKEERDDYTSTNSQLATIVYETIHSLQDGGFALQNAKMLENVLLALKEFPVPLTKEEKLMMINFPPTTTLQLSLVVRDADERLTEEQSQELLELLNKHLKGEES